MSWNQKQIARRRVGDPVNSVWIKKVRQWLAPRRCRLSTVLLTKVQRHVRFKQHVINHAVSCRPTVHHLRYLLPHVIGLDHSHPILFLCDLSSSYCCLYNTRSLASQPFTCQHRRLTAVVRCIGRRPHTAVEPVRQIERSEVQQCCIGVVCHSRRRVATDHASTTGN